MRASNGFIFGVIAGAATALFWRREIEDFADSTTRGVRTRAAEGLQAVAEGTGKLLDRGGDALRRAEEGLQGAKERVGDALRSGEAAIRATPAPGEAQT